MPYFVREEVRFQYCDRGAGLPVVFQHGLGSDVASLMALF
jgi:hypothetical protein